MNTKIHLFSYGSLQNEDVQLALYRRKLKGTKALLKNYKLSKEKILFKYPIIFKTSNSNDYVIGFAFEITSDELLITDNYEGDNYQRVKVKLESGLTAWCYVMQN